MLEDISKARMQEWHMPKSSMQDIASICYGYSLICMPYCVHIVKPSCPFKEWLRLCHFNNRLLMFHSCLTVVPLALQREASDTLLGILLPFRLQ